jgi:hypothetical protein
MTGSVILRNSSGVRRDNASCKRNNATRAAISRTFFLSSPPMNATQEVENQ